jgi:hypothetical protein
MRCHSSKLATPFCRENSPPNSRFVVFKKVSGGLAAGDNETKAEGRLKTSILPLDETGVSFGTMNTLVSGVLNGKKMRNISALPNIKTRTKKLEESERLKRDRKKDQERQRTQDDKKPPPQQTFSANDGTKEGRRLERERRRAEHNAENNNVPKTPEEIAEMEKRRRQRMEEEAAKWNIGSDESSEEGGESIDEGDTDYSDVDVIDMDDLNENDDDVLDLD